MRAHVLTTAKRGADSDLHVAWWIRVRWAATAAELLALAAATLWIDLDLPLLPMLAVVGVQALTNVGLSAARTRVASSEPIRALLLAVDAALLTALLYLSGGPNNPFSALYFVQVTLAAMLLGRAGAAVVWASTVVSYGLLFLDHRQVPQLGHLHGGALHLQGMFVAFGLTSGILAYFVVRLSQAVRRRDAALAAARDRAARARRVMSLTTLAAGAAHELGTPLSTIAVVAGELDRSLEGDARQDVRVICEEVARCRGILDSLSTQAGDVVGEGPTDVELRELAEMLRERLPPDRAARLDVVGGGRARVPAHAFAQLLDNLVGNAFDASDANGRVRVRIAAGELRVEDEGTGMDEATLARACEPFFTTKPEGAGMGLGLYLAQATAEAMGATLELRSRPGHGTTATLRWAPRNESNVPPEGERSDG